MNIIEPMQNTPPHARRPRNSYASAVLLWLLIGLARATPSDATLVYYNARMALREGHASEAVKLWLLRNAMVDRDNHVSAHDDDFRSVTWAALGDLGLCQDGYATDGDGVGLWPLALHNQFVRNLGRSKPAKLARPFLSFELDRQQRYISVTDIPNAAELKTLKFARTPCLRAKLFWITEGGSPFEKLTDRQVAARLLRRLLVKAKGTLEKDHVRGLSVIEARLFDIDLQLTSLAVREARARALKDARRGRELGMSRPSIDAMNADAPKTTLPADSDAARILRASASWPASEWLALEPGRRLFLYTQARSYDADPVTFDAIGLAILDGLIAKGDGAGVEVWTGQLADGDQRRIWDGERGAALLALDDGAGFRERSVIALHRGVDQLERGALMDALRSFAYARQHSDESRASAELEGLTLRWLTYVCSRFAITPDLLVTLQELVPRRDYSVILEDLLWTAAFHSDAASFRTGLTHQLGRGALERRLALLEPLASGDLPRFSTGLKQGLAESPSETLRFLNQLVQRLEVEDADLRSAHIPTLVVIRRVLLPLALDALSGGSQGRAAAELMERTQAIAEGVGGLPDESTRDRAHRLAPAATVYAGSIRLAPSDPLPWPFHPTDPTAPSIFTPLTLRPVEWRDPGGALVFGWSLEG